MLMIHRTTALVAALCLFLASFVCAADNPGPDVSPGLEDTLMLNDPTAPETPAEVEAPGIEAPESETPAAPPDGGEVAGEEAAGDAVADEDLETLAPEDMDLEMTVYYDERTGTDYVEIRTPEKIEEYHYLSHIRYSDLIFVLSDLLRRITADGYQWAMAPEISYEQNEEVALLYRKDLVNDVVYGIVQFPDFKVSLSALRSPDAEHRFNAENGRDMMSLVFSFASCLAQAEQTLGIKQLDYTMRFFKQE
jgi:hypothetical protein